MSFEVRLTAELQHLLGNFQNQTVLCVFNDVENLSSFIEVLSKAEESFIFTESPDLFKKLDEKTKNFSMKTNSNCAKLCNAEFCDNLFDSVVLIKSFSSLDKNEKEKNLKKILSSLKSNGKIFLYETESTTDRVEKGNPVDLIHQLNSTSFGSTNKVGFELIFARPLRTFVELKNEPFEFLYSFKKVEKHGDEKTFQEFLDQQQYSTRGVLSYEKIFGPGFVSTGGVDTTREFLEKLNLKENNLVLDVGCGIGGGDIFMAQNYGCSVIGVDLSTNMVAIAYDRLRPLKEKNFKVSFEIGDILQHEFQPNSFDVIYSRDTILHIPDKNALFSRLYGWLKPGGQIFITDYTCAPKEQWSKNYQEYVAQRRYNLLTVPDYGKVLESVGFTEVKAEDVTERFVECLKMELVRIELIKEEFIQEFSEDDYHHLVEGWHSKLDRCATGDQRWGSFHGKK